MLLNDEKLLDGNGDGGGDGYGDGNVEGLAIDDAFPDIDPSAVGDGGAATELAEGLTLNGALDDGDAESTETAVGLGISDADGEVTTDGVLVVPFRKPQSLLKGCARSMGISEKVSDAASYVVTATTMTSASEALMVVAKVDRRLSPRVQSDTFVAGEI